MKCIVCNSGVSRAFNHKVLEKYNCDYFYCAGCGFLQTEEPYWLDEAYSMAISDADTGMLQRNIIMSKLFSVLIYFLYGKQVKCVDSAGGYGALTRLMRDIGFDYHWMDKYCVNIFSRGFEFKMGERYDIVSAVEVLEHVHDPIEFIRSTLENTKANVLICTTELFKDRPPAPGEWWYYTFATGQHISFYQKKTLKIIAEKLGLYLYSNNGIHLFCKNKINPIVYAIITNPRLAGFISNFVKKLIKSKTQLDHINKS